MSFLITATFYGTVVIDPADDSDLQLLKLLSAKQILVQENDYRPGVGYVGQLYEPGTVTLGSMTEYPEVWPRGTGTASYQAYKRAQEEEAASCAA